MEVDRKCGCENSNLFLRLLDDQAGWFCLNCESFYGLDGFEEQLYKYAYNLGAKANEHKVKRYDQLREIIKEMK